MFFLLLLSCFSRILGLTSRRSTLAEQVTDEWSLDSRNASWPLFTLHKWCGVVWWLLGDKFMKRRKLRDSCLVRPDKSHRKSRPSDDNIIQVVRADILHLSKHVLLCFCFRDFPLLTVFEKEDLQWHTWARATDFNFSGAGRRVWQQITHASLPTDETERSGSDAISRSFTPCQPLRPIRR